MEMSLLSSELDRNRLTDNHSDCQTGNEIRYGPREVVVGNPEQEGEEVANVVERLRGEVLGGRLEGRGGGRGSSDLGVVPDKVLRSLLERDHRKIRRRRAGLLTLVRRGGGLGRRRRGELAGVTARVARIGALGGGRSRGSSRRARRRPLNIYCLRSAKVQYGDRGRVGVRCDSAADGPVNHTGERHARAHALNSRGPTQSRVRPTVHRTFRRPKRSQSVASRLPGVRWAQLGAPPGTQEYAWPPLRGWPRGGSRS